MEVKRLPLARPGDPYCQGLIERQFRRDRCITCRACREWRLEYGAALSARTEGVEMNEAAAQRQR